MAEVSEAVWTLGDVLEFVDHPERRVRCANSHPEQYPFNRMNRLGKLLNEFSAEEQDDLISNFFDTLRDAKDLEKEKA